ncbi:MAG: hypothetical protein C0502_09670 [Opitutus sp.]|nr:hypothetical protein [Opitutus sp.]
MLTTLAATGFTVAFLHAAIPTHWLPFVLVARARGWTRGKTIAVSMAAGLGHVLLTSLLGLGIAWLGLQLDEHFGELFNRGAGGVLLVVALGFFWRQMRGGVLHHHVGGSGHRASEHCGHEHDHSHMEEELKDTALVSRRAGDWAAIAGLFTMITLSPCEGFLPVYLSGVHYGWRGFMVLSGILAVGTLGGMLLFTWLTLVGFAKLPIQRLERYEAGLLGVVFAGLGLMMLFAEHGGR